MSHAQYVQRYNEWLQSCNVLHRNTGYQPMYEQSSDVNSVSLCCCRHERAIRANRNSSHLRNASATVPATKVPQTNCNEKPQSTDATLAKLPIVFESDHIL